MATPRVLILRAPGTNCDQESAYAFQQAGGQTEFIHVNRVLEQPKLLEAFQILCFPGGFSYGDDIAAGRILGNQVQHHLREALLDFKQAGKLILGICNGFQILVRTGLLWDEHELAPPATLTDNQSGRFECRWVHLKAAGTKCVFMQGIERLELPVAHAEGNLTFRNQAAMDLLAALGQLALHYSGPTTEAVAYPANPNGSQAHVAGLCDATGRIFGLMPHPERFIDPTHHPHWTRTPRPTGDGLALFQNAVNYFA